jgi:integrase/recombinase XerC
MRNAELVQLRPSDIDLQTCQVRITQGKGHKDRYVLFPSGFRGELAQYLEGQRRQSAIYLFESNRCRPYSTRRLRQIVKQYATAAGIAKRVYPHLLRHSCASHVLESSGDLRAVQELLGHASIASTQIYTHLDFQALAKTYDQAHPRARKKARR